MECFLNKNKGDVNYYGKSYDSAHESTRQNH